MDQPVEVGAGSLAVPDRHLERVDGEIGSQ
jgi:hypothetical protein